MKFIARASYIATWSIWIFSSAIKVWSQRLKLLTSAAPDNWIRKVKAMVRWLATWQEPLHSWPRKSSTVTFVTISRICGVWASFSIRYSLAMCRSAALAKPKCVRLFSRRIYHLKAACGLRWAKSVKTWLQACWQKTREAGYRWKKF